jgi:hypothetical protein
MCSARWRREGRNKKEMTMNRSVTKLLAALGLLAALIVPSASFGQSRPPTCIPHYDSSGAQTAPYC